MDSDNILPDLRAKIDRLDHELLDILAARIAVVDEVAKHKKAARLPVRDEGRRHALIADRVARAKSLGLPGEMVRAVFKTVVEHTEERQK